MVHQIFTTYTPFETAEIGRNLAISLARGVGGKTSATVICLYGDLGAGKTTFTQGFAKGLGIEDRLLSPTFIIVRRYSTAKNSLLYHMDLYRLSSIDDINALGFSEMVADPEAFIIIEWAERLGQLLPAHRMDIHFSALPDDLHRVQIDGLL